jgi:hypothetical protein
MSSFSGLAAFSVDELLFLVFKVDAGEKTCTELEVNG